MKSKPPTRPRKRLLLALLFTTFTATFLSATNAAETAKPKTFEIRRVIDQTDMTANANAETLPFAAQRAKPETPLRVAKEVLLDQSQVANAKTHKDPVSGQMEIQLKLTKTGADRFAKITKDSIGQRLAIVSNSKILTAPVIRSEIPTGNLVITGNLTPQEASDLTDTLNSRKK